MAGRGVDAHVLVSKGRGRGRGRIRWSGKVEEDNDKTIDTSEKVFDWKKVKVELDKSSCPVTEPGGQLIMAEADRKVNSKVVEVVKRNNLQVPKAVSAIVHPYLDTCEDPYQTLFNLAVVSSDFREGKAKGVTWNFLNTFQEYLSLRHTAVVGLNQMLQDRVFFKFSKQPSVAILKLAVEVFKLTDNKTRYKGAVIRMCEDGNFKTACDAAVALQLFDQFSIHIFCLPLLLTDKPSTMDTYLDRSPKAIEEMIRYLDYLSEVHNAERVSDLIMKYPMIKATGASKLSDKPLDRLIKKMIEKWNLKPELYPASSIRWARGDLHYWVKQMFSLDSEQGSLQLINWRELMERKVKDSREMQQLLVDTLLRFDMEEARLWSNKYELGVFSNEEQVEEEDWEQDIVEVEKEEYFKFDMTADSIMFIDTREQFHQFINLISNPALTVVGLDAEFMSSRSDQKISLLQLSTHERAFLLDWEVLPSCLQDEDYHLLANTVFARKDLLVIGYGVWGDIKLLSKSFTQLSNLLSISTAILDLETLKAKLSNMLGLPQTNTRGLSGLCESLLGLPLNKTDQISDWSRRPLRQSQIIYAALDAFVCLEIYKTAMTIAKEKGVSEELKEVFKTSSLKKVDKEKKEPKFKEKVSREILEKNVPDLVNPLFTTPSPPQVMKLVCDDMLQGLCRRLRLFGVDCLALDNGQDHMECVVLASGAEPRYVLSRGIPAARIAKKLPPGHTLSIKSNDLDTQVEEVFRYFNIVAATGDLFSRCVLCNGGHYYLLDRALLVKLSERNKEKKDWVMREIGVETGDEIHIAGEDLELDRFNEDFESDSDDEPNVFSAHYIPRTRVQAHKKRWEKVQVTSYHTGQDREGQVNMFTGETEEGVVIQVECMARATIDKYPQFWVCGKCGKVYFEGSHWGKATETLKSTMKQS